MTTDQPDAAGASEKPSDTIEVVLLTRRRWDWYFLPAMVIAGMLGLGFAIILDEWIFFLWPLCLLPLYLLLRFSTPASGLKDYRVSAHPGMLQYLGLAGFHFLLLIAALIFDRFVLGYNKHDPLQPHHFVVYPAILILCCIGIFFWNRRYREANKKFLERIKHSRNEIPVRMKEVKANDDA